jgi:PAS domain S-box-containing protein
MNLKQIHVLLLEDEAAHAEAIRRAVESSDNAFQVQIVGSLKEFRDYVGVNPPDIALLDMVLPDGNGIDLLKSLPQPNAFPMLILTSHGNENAAVEAIKAGALDYIVKSPETFAETPRILTRNLNQWALIQENKKIEQALHASEANFHNSMENSPLGIRIVSEDGETLYTNRAFLDIYGYKSLDEFNNTPVKDRYTPDSYIEFRERRDKRRRKEPLPDTYEISILRKNGTIRNLQVIRKEIIWAGKQHYQTIYRDVTERKQVAEALRVSEQNFRNSIDSSPMGIYITTPAWEPLYANQAFLDLFGYQNIEEVTKNPPHSFYTPESHALLQKRREAQKHGAATPRELDVSIQRKDGDIRYLHISRKAVIWNGAEQYQLFYDDITAGKQAQQALIASEVSYRRLFESAKDGILIIDAVTGLITDANPFLYNLLGLSLKEIKGKYLWQIGTFSDIVSSKDRFEELRQKGYVRYDDLPLKTIDGKQISVEFVSNVYDVDQRRVIQCNIRDITERKKAENALRLNETYLRATLDSTGDGILVVDNRQTIITTNNQFIEMFKVPRIWIAQKNDNPVLEHVTSLMVEPEAFLAKVINLYASAQMDRDVLRLKDGRIIERYSEPLMLQNQVSGRVWSFRDVTDLRKAQEALHTSEEKYRLIVEKSNDVIFTFDGSEQLTYISPSIKNALGYEPSELIGHTFGSLVHPEDLHILRKVIQRNMQDGSQTPGGNEYRIRNAAGEWRWHNGSGTAVLGSNGKFINFVGISRDITERKLMTIRLEELHKTMQLVTKINELIVKIDDEKEMLQEACNRFVKSRQYPLAWVGFTQEGSFDIPPFVQCGEKSDYLAAVNITWDNSPLGNGPTGIAIKTGKPDVVREMVHDPRYEPWKVVALKYGFKAAAAFPLIIQDKVIGVLNIYSGSVESFNKDEMRLLEELAGDLSLGIEKIRRREAQLKLEKDLKLSEQNFRNSLDSSVMGVRIVDPEGQTLYANQVFLGMFGFKNIYQVGRYALQDHYTPEEKARYLDRMARKQRGESLPDNPKVDIIDKDGVVRSIVIYSSDVLWNGKTERQLVYYDITARQQAEEALKLSEQNFRNSMDHSTIGIRIVDTGWHTLYANQVFMDIFGYKSVEEIGVVNPRELYTDREYARFLERHEKRQRGEPVSDDIEMEIIRKDGAIRYVQSSRSEVLWNGLPAYQLFCIDVTERVQAEEARNLSEQNFRNSLDSSLIGIRIVDADGRNLYLNRTFMNLFGYADGAEVEVSPPQEHYTPECHAEYLRRGERLAHGEPLPDNYEIDIIRKDGAVRHLQLFRQEVLWNGKKEWQILYNDITERTRAEAALKISEQNFRNSLDRSAMGIRIMGDGEETLYANQAMLDIFGYENFDELRKSPPQQHYTPESHTGFLQRQAKFARGEPLPDELEFDIIRKDGAVRHLQLSSRQIIWNGKQQYQILYNDITERVKAEQTLKASEEKYSTLIEQSSDGILILEDRKIVFANRKVNEMMGFTQVEILGKYFYDLAAPEYRGKLEEINRKRKTGAELSATHQLELLTKGGTKVAVETKLQPIIYQDKPAGMVIVHDITERIQAEAALKMSEENFRNSMDKSSIGIRISDNNDKNLYSNQALLDIFGYKNLAEIQANPPQNFYTPECYADFLARHEQFLRGEIMPKQIESDIKRKDGTVRNLQVSMMDVFWDGKKQNQTLYNDITERKQAEKALKLSEQNFRNSLEHSLIGIRIIDSGWHTLYANQAFLAMFGYENIGEADASTPAKIYAPEEYRRFLEREEKRRRGEPLPDTLEIDTIRKDGAVRRIQTTRREILWNGHPQFQIFYNDITERVQAEKDLKVSEQNFRNTLDSSLMGIFIGDSGNVLYVNQAFLEMFGFENLTEVKATRPIEFYSPASYAAYQDRRDRQRRGELNPDNFEIDVVRKDGSKRHLEVFRKEVLWDGKLQSQIIYNDVTALRQAEEERQRLEDKAQVASRLAVVGEMAAGVAHEINNPLTGVLGFSQMMLEKENVPDEIKAELQLIVDGSQRVADIVKRLLTFARQTKPVKTLTNINELIDNTLKLREYVLKTVNINVVTRFDPELPWSVADPGQLQQVFLNVIVNAEQAMKVAHGRGTLTITSEQKGNKIRISFQDDGPGITPENRKRLFEPFFTTKAPGEGTGLGLSLSRSIILEHNGTMTVESEIGRGANFIIELPIIESLPSGDDALLPPEKAKLIGAAHGKILVVDDEPGVRILLERVFTQMGHQVETVADAETAVSKLDSGLTYDVILTDVRMPGMSGIELHAYILKKTPAMKNKIIFITGDVMGADIKEFLTKNNLTYFAKPFDIEGLKGAVDSLMKTVLPPNGGAERSTR